MSRSLSFLLAALPLVAGEPGTLALEHLARNRVELGLPPGTTFKVLRVTPDPLLEGATVRVAQFHQGVRVMGGEAALRFSGERLRGMTDALVRGLAVDPTPSLAPSEALAQALVAVAPKGELARPPRRSLLVVRMDPTLGPSSDRLAYRVHTEVEQGLSETAHTDVLIDASTGEVLRRWSTLQTASGPAFGTGLSQYSGKVTLNTTRTDKGFELRDWTRGRTGNVVADLGGETRGDGEIFTSETNEWGDGKNYDRCNGTTSANGQTAAVDAAYGAQWTWDFLTRVLGWKGIDGEGRATRIRVHYGKGYDNAFWSTTCFCLTLGDGERFKSLQAMDVVAHEMAHGVCGATADLEYWGESGALNEANSDIIGTLVEFYARGGKDDQVGDWGGTWTIGEDLTTAARPSPLRYLYKPSKDGRSPDAWDADLWLKDVHQGSGPMNRAFFFLSQGASARRDSDYYSEYLYKGMEGLGNTRAARIWFRALAHHMTSATDYAGARKACISAAQELYGAGSVEEKAVWNAFHGICVGNVWPES